MNIREAVPEKIGKKTGRELGWDHGRSPPHRGLPRGALRYGNPPDFFLIFHFQEEILK
jgi:hypothetical protein